MGYFKMIILYILLEAFRYLDTTWALINADLLLIAEVIFYLVCIGRGTIITEDTLPMLEVIVFRCIIVLSPSILVFSLLENNNS